VAAAIGAGYAWDPGSTSSIQVLVISRSHVEDGTSEWGAAIGSSDGWFAMVVSVTISNSTLVGLDSLNGSVIGCGPDGNDINELVLLGSCFLECPGNGQMPTVNALSIMISAASVAFITNDMPLFGTSPSNSDAFDLVIGYHQATPYGNEHIESLYGPFLHIRNVDVPDNEVRLLEFCIRKAEFERCLDDRTGPIRSLIVGSRGEGNYSVPGWLDGVPHILMDLDNRTDFPIELKDSFIDHAFFVPLVFPPTTVFTGSELFVTQSYRGSSHPILTENCVQSHSLALRAGSILSDSLMSSSGYSQSLPPSLFAGYNESKPFTDNNDAQLSESEGPAVIWITLAGVLALLLVIVGAIFILAARRRQSDVATEWTDSDLGVPWDVDAIAPVPEGYVSEENALSTDLTRSPKVEFTPGDRDESKSPIWAE
jgi:hypothetical protein